MQQRPPCAQRISRRINSTPLTPARRSRWISGCPNPNRLTRKCSGGGWRQHCLAEPAWIATAEDVILHKLVWNRITPSDRQLGDAAGVVAVQADALDKNYLRRWARELNWTNELERLLSGEIKPKQK